MSGLRIPGPDRASMPRHDPLVLRPPPSTSASRIPVPALALRRASSTSTSRPAWERPRAPLCPRARRRSLHGGSSQRRTRMHVGPSTPGCSSPLRRRPGFFRLRGATQRSRNRPRRGEETSGARHSRGLFVRLSRPRRTPPAPARQRLPPHPGYTSPLTRGRLAAKLVSSHGGRAGRQPASPARAPGCQPGALAFLPSGRPSLGHPPPPRPGSRRCEGPAPPGSGARFSSRRGRPGGRSRRPRQHNASRSRLHDILDREAVRC